MESRWTHGVHVESMWNLWGSVKYRETWALFLRSCTSAFELVTLLLSFGGHHQKALYVILLLNMLI